MKYFDILTSFDLWKAFGGLGRPWEALGGLGKALGGLRRPWARCGITGVLGEHFGLFLLFFLHFWVRFVTLGVCF